MTWDMNDNQISDLLSKAATYFNLGKIEKHEALGGNANKNFLVLTDAGEYVLKVVLEHTSEDLALEVAYQVRLAACQFPAAFYLRGTNNSAIFTYQNTCVVAMPRVIGAEPPINENTCRLLGRDLAQLHTIPSDGLSARKSWLSPTYLSTAMAEIGTHFPDTLSFSNAFRMLQDFPYELLPKTIIHGDVNEGNCLVRNNNLTYFDWEEVGIAPAILDLGMTFMNFCCDEHGMKSDLIHTMVDAYQTVRKLSDFELKYLAMATQYAGFTISVWAQLQFGLYLVNPENLKWANFYWDAQLDTFTLDF